jgi:hypothetical protein
MWLPYEGTSTLPYPPPRVGYLLEFVEAVWYCFPATRASALPFEMPGLLCRPLPFYRIARTARDAQFTSYFNDPRDIDALVSLLKL